LINGHPAVFLMMSRLNGYSDDPALHSLAGLMPERGGVVVVWASSGMTPLIDSR
jgi:hypothetical protein